MHHRTIQNPGSGSPTLIDFLAGVAALDDLGTIRGWAAFALGTGVAVIAPERSVNALVAVVLVGGAETTCGAGSLRGFADNATTGGGRSVAGARSTGAATLFTAALRAGPRAVVQNARHRANTSPSATLTINNLLNEYPLRVSRSAFV